MASISSTNSASSANSLGNTSLRGFGGMVSGIDRDSIIEQMTLGTTTKINKVKTQITELGWKQEAYRSISDKILDLTDNYTSFSSSKTLVDPNLFARNIINVNGLDSAAKFVKASGNSDVIDSLSIKAVKQLASAAMQQSKGYGGSLVTGLDASQLTEEAVSARESALKNTWLRFKIEGIDGLEEPATILFENTYTKKDEVQKKDADGNPVFEADGTTPVMVTKESEVAIDYNLTGENATLDDLAKQLNGLLEKYSLTKPVTDPKDNTKTYSSLADMIEFKATADGKLTIDAKNGLNVQIDADSEALGVLLGEEKDKLSPTDGYITMNNFETAINATTVKYAGKYSKDELIQSNDNSILKRHSGFEVLTGATATFSYNGDVKNIMLLTKDEAEALQGNDYKKGDGTFGSEKALGAMAEFIQGRIDRVYGEGNINVNYNKNGGTLEFETVKDNSFFAMTANDKVRDVLGIESGTSSRINIDEGLMQKNLGLGTEWEQRLERSGDTGLSMVINGTTISGITKNTTIDEILTKINESDAGVKASYVESTGQFVLVADKTGSGREIKFDSVKDKNNTSYDLAETLFGGTDSKGSDGQDAQIVVNYGNGVDVTLSRSSNTFNLEGLDVTVSGIFGGDWVNKVTNQKGEGVEDPSKLEMKEDGNYYDQKRNLVDENGFLIKQYWVADATETVTFDAKADVDKATERVKSFFEDYNALVSEVYKQLTTRKDRSYGALTDEQKAEMSEDEIEKWETKAKEGLLYNDSNMEALNSDLEGMLTKWMNSGVSYADLEKIGITYVTDWSGGASTINFDEDKFRKAMEDTPELVSDIFTGAESGRTGIVKTLDNTLTTYATRYANRNDGSYGRLIEEAGSEKLPTTEMKNYIYNELKEMNERLKSLQDMLKTKQERYIKQFSSMESLINQYNSQSSYLSQITG